MDNAASIKKEVQDKGRYIARLPSKTAARTIAALVADDYGVKLLAKMDDGWELWRVVGEPDEPLRVRLCTPMSIGDAARLL